MHITAQTNRRDLMKWLLAAAAGSVAQAGSGASAGISRDAVYEAKLEATRSRIHHAIARGDATGVAVVLVHRGEIIWQEGFGWANREAGLKATPHTPFSMASITKPFTAATIMTLVAEGRLSLDDPANHYLGESKLVSSNGDANAATVRMLGAHASGLPGIYESYEADEARLVPTPDALLQAYGRLAYPPAACYEYSNIGFAALHAIAAALTQTELGALMRRNLLLPLGLDNSFFGADPIRLQRSATRYDPRGRAIPHYTTSTPASGELYASAHDLARFALFNMRHRDKSQTVVLSDRNLNELHRPVFTGPSGVATTFGWFMGHTDSGIPFFFKSGGDPGVANRICFVPLKDLACAVVTNQSNSGELAYSVVDDLIKHFLPEWQRPEEDCGFPGQPFIAGSIFRGQWRGSLEGDGTKMPVQLQVESNESATLAIGSNQAELMTGMRAEGEALTGESTGQISSPDAIRSGARRLQVKLFPRNNRLTGRVFAVAGDPNFKSVRLPYVLTLSRA